MDDRTLDAVVLQSKDNNRHPKPALELIPVLLLIALGILSYFTIEAISWKFVTPRLAIGYVILAVCLILFFYNRRAFRYTYGIGLLLALFKAIQFTIPVFWIRLLGVRFDVPILLFVFYYWILYRKDIVRLYRKKNASGGISYAWKQSPEEYAEAQRNKTAQFKKRFSRLRAEEIDQRLDFDLVPEARAALLELREELEKKLNN